MKEFVLTFHLQLCIQAAYGKRKYLQCVHKALSLLLEIPVPILPCRQDTDYIPFVVELNRFRLEEESYFF